jgi:hypothetical protein
MAEVTITIPGELTDLNTHLDQTNTHWASGNEIKQMETEKVKLLSISHRKEAKELELPIDIHFRWVCANRRKDKDNIRFAAKYILDGLVAAEIIPNDGWKEVGDLSDSFEVDKENPRVEITLSN